MPDPLGGQKRLDVSKCNPGGSRRWLASNAKLANPICLKLDLQCCLRADSRAAITAGMSRPIAIAMQAIAMTNSSNENPAGRLRKTVTMEPSLGMHLSDALPLQF
jgi:hypothetical protein